MRCRVILIIMKGGGDDDNFDRGWGEETLHRGRERERRRYYKALPLRSSLSLFSYVYTAILLRVKSLRFVSHFKKISEAFYDVHTKWGWGEIYM
jgi:hypothetical protein